MRYSRERTWTRPRTRVGREILARIAHRVPRSWRSSTPLALIVVIRRFERDLRRAGDRGRATSRTAARRRSPRARRSTGPSPRCASPCAARRKSSTTSGASWTRHADARQELPLAHLLAAGRRDHGERGAGARRACRTSRTACSSASSSPRPRRRRSPWAPRCARWCSRPPATASISPRCYGVEQTFDEVFSENPEFSSIAITDATGRVLYARGKEPATAREYFSRPAVLGALAQPEKARDVVKIGGAVRRLPAHRRARRRRSGMLHIGIDSAFVDRVLLEVLLDVLVVLVVSLFFTLELLNFMAGARLASGLGEFTRQVERMRSGRLHAQRAHPRERRDRAAAALDRRGHRPHQRALRDARRGAAQEKLAEATAETPRAAEAGRRGDGAAAHRQALRHRRRRRPRSTRRTSTASARRSSPSSSPRSSRAPTCPAT